MEEEFEAVRDYCIKREFKLSEDEMKTIKSIGLEDWFEEWRNKNMEEYILNECRKYILKFHNMSDTEIYNWMCNNYKGYKNYEIIRKCSFIIFEESR